MKLTIKKLNKMKLFIEAANNIIKNKGIQKTTVRNIAKKAGYNSATMYNYFDDLDHLIFFTKISRLGPYSNRLSKEIKDSFTPLERFLKIWEVFANEAFNHPKTFYDLFFSKYSKNLSNSLRIYYEIFPNKLNVTHNRLVEMLNESNIYKRNMTLIDDCLENGCFIDKKNADNINEIMVITFRGLLDKYMESEKNDPEKYTQKYMTYLNNIIRLETKK
ncbi:MAG: TetR/AcrR family transcriptional regulator [Bacillota bacterium]